MRTISYDEYILNIKSDFYYINLKYRLKHDKSYLKNIILEAENHFDKSFNLHPITMFVEYLEVLVYDKIVTVSEINDIFNNIEVKNELQYKRLLEYTFAFEERQSNNKFPYKLEVDINNLKDIINSHKEFNKLGKDINYVPYNLTSMTYEELINYYKNSDLYQSIKSSFTDKPVYDEFIFNRYKYTYVPAYKMVNIMQILIDEKILTNDYINKMFSDIEKGRTGVYIFPLLFDYLKEYLYIKHTSWHKYTLELDVDMLLNKVMLYYIDNENKITKDRFTEALDAYNITLDYTISKEKREDLDNHYRGKYELLCNTKRIISYEELVYKIKLNGEYDEQIVPSLLEDKSNLEGIIMRDNSSQSYDNRVERNVDILDILYYENVISEEDVNQCFNNIKIDSKEKYNIIWKYLIAYEYRKQHPIFPFKLHVDISILENKLKNTPKDCKESCISYPYNLDYIFDESNDEIINKCRENESNSKLKHFLIKLKIFFKNILLKIQNKLF